MYMYVCVCIYIYIYIYILIIKSLLLIFLQFKNRDISNNSESHGTEVPKNWEKKVWENVGKSSQDI